MVSHTGDVREYYYRPLRSVIGALFLTAMGIFAIYLGSVVAAESWMPRDHGRSLWLDHLLFELPPMVRMSLVVIAGAMFAIGGLLMLWNNLRSGPAVRITLVF